MTDENTLILDCDDGVCDLKEIEDQNISVEQNETEILNDFENYKDNIFNLDLDNNINFHLIGGLNILESVDLSMRTCEHFVKITNKLKKYDAKNKTKYKDLFLKWVVFLYKVESIVTNVKMSLDLHGGNFGYDNAGNLKCLDI
jgi:hypothetical protein